ncbi:MAG: TonB-dependent receptor [candidate division KSB1 bacterium]|nr:TonB-dependent receptor [candidate division KSB1 bacterium]
MRKRILVSALGVLFFLTSASAQSRRVIQGQIKDAETGMPLPGANIFVMPANAGTVSDDAGRFKLTISPERRSDSLHVRFMGYRSVTLPILEAPVDLQVKLQPTTVLFREVVVTATRQANPAAQVPVAIELLDVAASSHASKQTVGEILTGSQSVLIQERGGLSGLKTVTLRGAQATQILVMQDNLRLNNPQNGLVDLNLLPLLGTDRIEVARGSASAQYGSEAIGGVIHLRTLPPPNRFAGQAEYTLGSFGTDIKRVRLGHAAGPLSGILGFGRVQSEGDFVYQLNGAHSARRNNALDRSEFYGRAEANFSPRLRAAAFYQSIDNTQGTPGSLSFSSTTAKLDDKNHLAAIHVEWRQHDVLQLNAHASFQKLDQTFSEPAFAFSSRHQVDGRELILHNRSRVQRQLDFLYGIEFSHYELQSTDLGQPQRDQRSGFIQAEWRQSRVRKDHSYEWLILPAVRFDDYSDAGQRLTPKLGLMWRRVGAMGLTARANAGQSFRVPNLNELFWPSSPYYSGNPNLQPEIGSSVDGGLVLQISQAGNWQMEINGFYSALDNLIIDTPDASGRLMPQNIEKAKLSGLESSLAWHSVDDRLTFKIAHTYLKATNEGETHNGKSLIYRPQDKLDASVGFAIANFYMHAAYQFVGKRFIDPQNTATQPAYSLVNLAIGGKLRLEELRFGVNVELRNVFDEQYSVIADYPMPGREFRATFRLGY